MKYEMYPDELKHYGVLGMKWGIHRARKRGQSYRYTSRDTKRLIKEARMAKLEGKHKEYRIANAKAKASQDFDDRKADIVKKMSIGKTIVAAIAPMSVNTAVSYRAAGNTKSTSILVGTGTTAISTLVGSSAGIITSNISLNKPVGMGIGVGTAIGSGISMNKAIRNDYIDKKSKKYMR